jgi:hypothetical protein
LRAKANSQSWPSGLDAAIDDTQLIDQKWIFVLLVAPDRPTKDDHNVVHNRIDSGQIIHARIEITDLIACVRKYTCECSEVLKMDM